MSAQDEPTADEVLEARTGTRVPYTQVGDWVLLSDLSPMAKLLYALLAAHVNVSEGDRKVWPSLVTLAGWMGVKQPRSVSKYIAELEALGAVRKEQQRTPDNLRTRNIYYVEGEPPTGLTTPTRLSDFYKQRADARRAKSAGESVVRSSAPRVDQAKRVSAGRGVVRSSAVRGAPERQAVVRSSAPEQDQLTQQDEPTTREAAATRDRRPPVRDHASAATAPATPGAELALIPPPPGVIATTPKVTGRDVASAWVDTYRASVGAEPTRHQIGQVARESKALLEAGNRADRVLYAARSVASRGKALVTAEFAELSAAAQGRATTRPAVRRSTTDERVSQGLDLVAYYASLENEEATSR